MGVGNTKAEAEIVVRQGAQAGGRPCHGSRVDAAVFDAVFEVAGEEYRANEPTNERGNSGLKRKKVNNTALPREDKFPQVTLGYGRGKGNNRQIDQCSGTWTLEMR